MQVIAKELAKQLGHKRFFTGRPCSRGHVAERLVSNNACIECTKELQKARYKANPNKRREHSRAYRLANPEKVSASLKSYRENNKERRAASWASYYEKNKDRLYEKKRLHVAGNRDAYLATQRAWRENNKGKRTALQARREARKAQAMPPWFCELDEFVWQEAADLVIRRREITGIEWAADHMIPISGRAACGLHTWNNCQVIPWKLNQSKHNKLVLTEPGEWITCMPQNF